MRESYWQCEGCELPPLLPPEHYRVKCLRAIKLVECRLVEGIIECQNRCNGSLRTECFSQRRVKTPNVPSTAPWSIVKLYTVLSPPALEPGQLTKQGVLPK